MQLFKSIVTGATGFLGGELVNLLLSMNCPVLALGRNSEKLKSLDQLGAQTQSVSLENFDPQTTEFGQVDIVYHCAAFSSAWGDDKEFERVNVAGTVNVVNWCKAHGVKRIVYISSTSVYFNFSDSLNINEKHPMPNQFVNTYARTKYQAEQSIIQLATGKLEHVILRPRGIIGKGDTAILPRILKITNKGWFPLLRNGQALVDLTHVKNVAEAAFLAATTENISGEIFNLSNDEPVKVHYLLECIIKRLPVPVRLVKVNVSVVLFLAKVMQFVAKKLNLAEPILTPYGIGLLSCSQTLNIEKAKNVLGYQPRYRLDEAIESCFDDE